MVVRKNEVIVSDINRHKTHGKSVVYAIYENKKGMYTISLNSDFSKSFNKLKNKYIIGCCNEN